MSKSDSNSAFKIVASLIILALCGLSSYLYMGQLKLKEQNSIQRTEINELTGFYSDLNDEFTAAKDELNSMKTDNEELNALIEVQKADLDVQRKRINRLVRENKDLGQAKIELANIRNRVSGYIQQIEQLTGQNKVLANSNFVLQEEKKLLLTEIETERTKAADLATAKSTLLIEKEELARERGQLASKVDIASIVQARNIETQGFKVKGNGKLAKKSRAGAVDLLQVCFQADKNLVAKPGEETFYIRLIDPIGETMAIESMGSGVLNLSNTSEVIRYTKSTTIEYANETTPICVQWRPESSFKKGIYQVEIYNKGSQVGTSEFKLK